MQELVDRDGDGYSSEADCDDADADVHPSAPEVCDGFDQDCDGTVDNGATIDGFIDLDGDGFGATPATGCDGHDVVKEGGDCDDWSPTVHPGADDVCNGLDDDCDGDVDMDFEGGLRYGDADGDGYGSGDPRIGCSGPTNADDCDDADRWVNPGEVEECQPGDQDCDGFDLVSNWCIAMDSTDADFTFYTTADDLTWGGVLGDMDTLRDTAGLSVFPLQVSGYDATRWSVLFEPFPTDPLVAVEDYTGAVLYTGHGSASFGRPTDSSIAMLVSDTYYRVAVATVPITGSVDVDDIATTFIEGPEVTPVGPGHDPRPNFGAGIGEDIDGDGLDEVVGSTWGAPVDTMGVWASPLSSGTLGIDSMTWSWQHDYSSNGPHLGTTGDIDDDGYADVVITAVVESHNQVGLYLGARFAGGDGTPSVADAVWLGEGADDEIAVYGPCGNAAAAGQSSVLVGAPNFGRTWDGPEGTLYLVDDRATSGTVDLRDVTRIRSAVRDSSFARSAGCGDFNGDGFTDIVASAPIAQEHGEVNVGELNVFYGPLSGDIDAADAPFRIIGDRSGANDYFFGLTLRTGDFNADGIDDFWASGVLQQRFFLGSSY